jgi:hypothetical protein
MAMPVYTIKDTDGTSAQLELDRGFSLTEQRRTAEGSSLTVEYAGHRIVLRERRRGSIEAEGDHTRTKGRFRTGKRLFCDAVEWAVFELHQKVRGLPSPGSDHGGEIVVSGLVRTLAQARALAYERRVWAHCSLEQQKKYQRQLDILLVLHGPEKRLDRPWSQSDVDLHFAARCGTTRNGRRLSASELSAFGIREVGIRFPKAYRRGTLAAAKPITAKNELRDIKVLLGYLKGQSVGEGRFLAANPLDDLDFGNAIRGSRADYHPERFRWLLAAADLADATGQLRMAVVLAFHTARRIGAILPLEMEHVAFTTREVRALLRRCRRTHESEPTAMESWAPHFLHGAIYWIMENDKEGFDRVAPINTFVLAELQRYLEKRTRLLGGCESRWLFPHRADSRQSAKYNDLTALLRAAEEIARPHIDVAGLDADEIMPETPGDAWHPGRGWWEARRSELLWEGNRNSAYVGGWTCNTGAVQSTVYGELDPRLMLACMEGLSLHEAARDLGLIDSAKSALHPEEPRFDLAA